MRNYPQFFAICNKNGFTKEEVILQYTEGKKDSLKDLADVEYYGMMRWLEKFNTMPPGNEIRRKMIALAKKMNRGNDTKQILQHLDGWCRKQKFKKPLMLHTVAELGVVCTIYEDKVYGDYLRDLNK